PAATPRTAPAPTPAIGRSVIVDPLSGTTRIRRPGSHTFKIVRRALKAPVGSEFDTRRGSLVLTSALPGGRVQQARFGGATFKVRQSRGGRGMTDIILTGDAPAASAGRAGGVMAAAVPTRKKPPSLWAHDSHGRYRTFGRNSVATVRGTTWRTTELATGTLTQVTSGAVSVRDLRGGVSVMVRAGGRYLARGA
ncbi:MAG: hypothetical protein M3P44_04880, partial [Actinomycetota bacterium]|nr:hypothetical protein [Actinomycetota bacterium]